uniref:GATA zinc finger domain-containing protein 10-like n=1 Tax=Fragaria vesca subsp. vesca TaxID=101020 RepID=UPI0005C8545F|nr:PREDICTED: GATA zinc finger domain-containing protein 10-like [Fragaria vesca subsp. vesca]
MCFRNQKMDVSIDLTLTLGLPSANDSRVPRSPYQVNTSAAAGSQGFGSGASAGNAYEREYYDATSTIMEFEQRSVSREMKYCVIDVSITKGKVGGSKKRKTPHSDERPVVPKPEDRNRRCTNINCRASQTPMWRTGPLGPKVSSTVFICSLCNACGIRYRKLKLKEKQGEGAYSGEGSSSAS